MQFYFVQFHIIIFLGFSVNDKLIYVQYYKFIFPRDA